MTNSIKTALVAFSAVFAFAGVAQAEDVKISVVGKDAKTVQAEIVHAAYRVCRFSNFNYGGYAVASEASCVNDTIAKADADLRSLSAPRMAVAEATQLGSR